MQAVRMHDVPRDGWGSDGGGRAALPEPTHADGDVMDKTFAHVPDVSDGGESLPRGCQGS